MSNHSKILIKIFFMYRTIKFSSYHHGHTGNDEYGNWKNSQKDT